MSAGEASEKKVLAAASAGQSRSDETYQRVPEGQLLAQIRVGDSIKSSATINFRKGSSYTMVVWNSDGKWEAKLFRDSGADPSTQRHVRVINFADGREASVRIDDAKPQNVAGAALAELAAPLGIAMVHLEVTDPEGGPPAKSSVEIDFSAYLNSYVVIAPDYRGRMRPRVFGGGRTRESLDAEAAASPAKN